MKKNHFYRHTLSLLILLCFECKADMIKINSNDTKGRPAYFESFSGYGIPLKLVGEITQKEAFLKKSYYIGYFDKNNRLLRVEKYLDGDLFFCHVYEYFASGSIKTNTVKNNEGVTTVNSFGDVVKSKTKPK